MPLSVWQIDPIHLTPYYNLALCAALAQAGGDMHYATSQFVYDTALLYPGNIQIHFFYFPQADHNQFLGHSSVRSLRRTLEYPIGHWRLLQAIDANTSSIVHIQWARLPYLDRWLISQLHQRGIPIVYTAHDVEPLFSKAFNLFKIYTAADAIIVHTEANRDLLLRRFPKLLDKVRVIPHPAPEWVIPSNANRAAARAYLGLGVDVSVVLFFGSNRPYKGLDMLVEAYTRAQAHRPDLWLLIAGRLDDPGILTDLRKSQVFVKPEYIPSDQVWLYHLAADIAVFPYRQISQSGELITAMSFGLPVIVTDIGGMPETVGENGWVVPPDDPIALSEAILDAFSDMPRLKMRASRSAQLIHEAYSPTLVAKQTMKLYYEVI
jgi:glycosyltransferase involved in cell wall biosynthesis